MDYIGDVEYWDEKFVSGGNRLLDPEKSLVDNIGYFKKGTLLDVACGDGRNSIFLIERGFQVTGIDFSSKALIKLDTFAKKNNYKVNLKQVDLSKSDSLDDIDLFDNIVINHYRLNKKALSNIKNHIKEDGILFICGFGEKHKIDTKIRKEDLIQYTDLEDVNKSFKLINYIENLDERGFIVTYIFKKNRDDKY